MTRKDERLVRLYGGVLVCEEGARDWIAEAFAPTAEQWKRLERFGALLIAENERQNLVAVSTIPTIWVRHIADSAQLLSFDTREGEGLWVDQIGRANV